MLGGNDKQISQIKDIMLRIGLVGELHKIGKELTKDSNSVRTYPQY